MSSSTPSPDGDAPALPLTLTEAMAIWAEECPALPQPRDATPKRRRNWKTRCATPGFSENWRKVCRRVGASSYCRGAKEWVATIDWLLERPDAWIKALEGAYDDRAAPPRPDAKLGAHTTDEKPPTREEAERRYREWLAQAESVPAGEVRDRIISAANRFAMLNGIKQAS